MPIFEVVAGNRKYTSKELEFLTGLPVMPAPGEQFYGHAYIYTGTTDAGFGRGHLYFCDRERTGGAYTYAWRDISTNKNGLSAYELAVSEGFEGTAEDWLLSLRGPKGEGGAEGPKGDTGHGMRILGQFDTFEDLAAAVTEPEIGDQYEVGISSPFAIWLWTVNAQGIPAWINQGSPVSEIPTASAVPTTDGGNVQAALDGLADALAAHSAAITDLESREAGDIPTGTPGVSVQAALDAHTSEIAALHPAIAALCPEMAIIPLPADAWTQNGDFFEQTASHGIFAEDGYIYDPAPVPARIFAAAGLGGIVLAEPIADGSAIFQCPSLPDIEIKMQIRRMPQKEDA